MKGLDRKMRKICIYLWRTGCVSLICLNVFSLMIVFYLKYLGETKPLSIYDNFYFALHYLLCFGFSLTTIDMVNYPISKQYADLISFRQFLSVGFLLTEFEALIIFVYNNNRLKEDLAYDEEGTLTFMYLLFAAGCARFALLWVGFYFSQKVLCEQIQKRRARSKVFGRKWTYLSDWTILQLYVYTNCLYDYWMPMFLFTSSVVYVYFKYVR